MTYDPNQVQCVALEERAAGHMAIRLRFIRPHTPTTYGLFLGQLANGVQSDDGILVNAEVHKNGQEVCLVPVTPTREHRHFKALAESVGYSGPIRFAKAGPESLGENASRWKH